MESAEALYPDRAAAEIAYRRHGGPTGRGEAPSGLAKAPRFGGVFPGAAQRTRGKDHRLTWRTRPTPARCCGTKSRRRGLRAFTALLAAGAVSRRSRPSRSLHRRLCLHQRALQATHSKAGASNLHIRIGRSGCAKAGPRRDIRAGTARRISQNRRGWLRPLRRPGRSRGHITAIPALTLRRSQPRGSSGTPHAFPRPSALPSHAISTSS